MEKLVNGINVEQVFNTIEFVKQHPDVATFRFRARNAWVDGTHNRATIKDFYGGTQEDDTREAMVFEMDEPPILCGKNLGANPVEYLLAALSGCLTTSLVVHAAAKGIVVKKITSRYEGEIDLRGFLGLSDEVPVGYKHIEVSFTIEADITTEQKVERVMMAQKYSPVFNTNTKSAPVSVYLEE